MSLPSTRSPTKLSSRPTSPLKSGMKLSPKAKELAFSKLADGSTFQLASSVFLESDLDHNKVVFIPTDAILVAYARHLDVSVDRFNDHKVAEHLRSLHVFGHPETVRGKSRTKQDLNGKKLELSDYLRLSTLFHPNKEEVGFVQINKPKTKFAMFKSDDNSKVPIYDQRLLTQLNPNVFAIQGLLGDDELTKLMQQSSSVLDVNELVDNLDHETAHNLWQKLKDTFGFETDEEFGYNPNVVFSTAKFHNLSIHDQEEFVRRFQADNEYRDRDITAYLASAIITITENPKLSDGEKVKWINDFMSIGRLERIDVINVLKINPRTAKYLQYF